MKLLHSLPLGQDCANPFTIGKQLVEFISTTIRDGYKIPFTERRRHHHVISKIMRCNTLVRMCGILISGPANRFSSFRSCKKISFHRPVSVREHRRNLVKGALDHLWAILAVYLCLV